MRTLSIKHMLNSVEPENKERMVINMNTIINSLFGFLIALTFNDIKDTLVENVLLKIVHANINKEKTKVKILNAEINLELIFLIQIFFPPRAAIVQGKHHPLQ